jgi:hypothetical protein
MHYEDKIILKITLVQNRFFFGQYFHFEIADAVF